MFSVVCLWVAFFFLHFWFCPLHQQAYNSYGSSSASVVLEVLAMDSPRFASPIYDEGEVHLGAVEAGNSSSPASFPCYQLQPPEGGRPFTFGLEGVAPPQYEGHFRFSQI